MTNLPHIVIPTNGTSYQRFATRQEAVEYATEMVKRGVFPGALLAIVTHEVQSEREVSVKVVEG